MRRREFITLLGSTVVVWPLAARAQQATIPVVGVLYAGVPETTTGQMEIFRKGLAETGFVEGRNVAFEYRYARSDFGRLPELAAELVRHGVAVIAMPQSAAAAFAAKAVTTTLPIVFSAGGDPVIMGLVSSLNRPGGNTTGINSMNTLLGAKRIGLLHELLPAARRFAFLTNPSNIDVDSSIADATAAIAAIGGAGRNPARCQQRRNRRGVRCHGEKGY